MSDDQSSCYRKGVDSSEVSSEDFLSLYLNLFSSNVQIITLEKPIVRGYENCSGNL